MPARARPGAWLLDYVHTATGVIFGEIKPSVIYSAVLNQTHLELLELCFPDAAISAPGCSLDNRGNQMEALCWLLFEADSPEMNLAQAYHCYRRARAAQLAEAGATDSSDEPHQAASMQALILFGQQFGYFFKAADQQTQTERAERESLLPQSDRHSSDTYNAGSRSSPSCPPPGAFASSTRTSSDQLRIRYSGPSPPRTG